MAFEVNSVSSRWAGLVLLLCLVAYSTRALTPNMFILVVAAIAAVRTVYEQG